MSDSVVAEGVFNVAGVFSGVDAVDFLDEQRSLGQLSQPVAWLKNGASHFPCNFRRGYSDGETRQFDVLLVGSREFVIERRDLCRY